MDLKGEQWRKEFEEKNLKVLLEMGNALKSLKVNITQGEILFTHNPPNHFRTTSTKKRKIP